LYNQPPQTLIQQVQNEYASALLQTQVNNILGSITTLPLLESRSSKPSAFLTLSEFRSATLVGVNALIPFNKIFVLV
jgi:hypothetical protein